MAPSHRRPANGLDLPQFLADFATKFGADALKGSVLLLRLEREIDDLMSFALGLSRKFHHGHPSPWSHCVLITSRYDANKPISILDCTIRDSQGKVDWKFSLEEFLSKPLDQQGDIYPGCVGDYVDKRVTRFGIKFMPTLSNADRDRIVARAWALKRKRYYYDIPGLFRELLRFLTEIELPPPNNLLHCSGFCQKAYFDALRRTGMFDLTVLYPANATDDEIWYPSRGTPYPRTILPQAAALHIAVAAPSVRRKPRPRRRPRP